MSEQQGFNQKLSLPQTLAYLVFGIICIAIFLFATNSGLKDSLPILSSTESPYVEACTNHYSNMGKSLNDIGLSNNRSTWSKTCKCISKLDGGKTIEDFKRNTSMFMQAHIANFGHCSK